MDWDKIVETYKRLQEEMILHNAEQNKKIEDAVLIMNPVHKKIIIEGGLKSFVIWSPLCPEDKIYMITDEKWKEEIKSNYINL